MDGLRRKLVSLILAALCLAAWGMGAGVEASQRALYIVRLREPSVSERIIALTPQARPIERRRLLRDGRSSAFAAQVAATQLAVGRRIDELNARGTARRSGTGDPAIELLGSCRVLTNSLFVRASAEAVESLRLDPAIRSINRALLRRPLLDTAVDTLKIPAIWERLGGAQNAGNGIKIGIIDSGIEPTHPMLGAAGLSMPSGFPKGNTAFTTNKIIVARSFHQLFPNSQPNQTPEDELGHGTSVATIAAGGSIVSPVGQIQGVAPRAYIGSYKVFGDPDLNGSTTSAAIIAALDAALADGMDVVNLSLGGPAANPATDPEQQAIAQAVQTGMVVVIAAGNSGPSAGTTESPGTSPEAITVGAIGNAKTYGSGIRVYASPDPPADLRHVLYIPGQGVVIDSPVGAFPLQPVQRFDPSELACTPLPTASLKGKIALVRRGNCYFQTKAENVFSAGAEALIVYNNVEGSAVTMAFDSVSGPGGPAVMIGMEPGERLRDLAVSRGNMTVQIDSTSDKSSFPAPGDELEAFSSRGPTLTQEIKPDLVAIGSRLYAGAKGGQFTSALRGTSFSTPMVAGAAALLRQLHPTWSTADIKSALVSTADASATWNGRTARVNEVGNGILDMERAGAALTTVAPVSVSFGVHSNASLAGSSLTRQLAVRNLSPSRRSYSATFEPTVSNDSVAVVIIPAFFSLAPGQETTLTVSAVFGTQLVPGIFEGHIQVTDASGTGTAAPVWGGVAIPDPSTTLQVSADPSAPYSSLEDALKAAQPGNVIEVTGSGSFPTNVTVRYNDEGLPLNDLTIRGAAGQLPTLDGSILSGSDPVLRIDGLQHVTVAGLRLVSNSTAVEFRDATGVLRNNSIRTSMGPNSRGLSASNSEVHVFENEFAQSESSAVALVSSNALIQRNIVGSLTSDQRNGGNGIFTSVGDAVAIFDNSIAGNGSQAHSGQGVRIADSTALMKGNRITATQGSAGDGIQLTGVLSHMEGWDNWVSGNERAGLALFNGAGAELHFSRLFENATAGALVNPTSSLTASGVWFDRNLNGLLATDATLTLFSSAVSGSTSQGIRATNGALDVRNSTIYGNGQEGIVAAGSSEAEVVNSVVFNNLGTADITGIPSARVTYSLTGDTQYTPAQNNLSGDPQLTDPQGGDFSPAPGSSLIDAGTDAHLPTDGILDLNGHRRTVDGNGDGWPQVDVGAVEAASHHSVPLVLPVFSTEARTFVGLALTNSLEEPASEEQLRNGASGAASSLLSEVELREHFTAPQADEVHLLASRGRTQKSLLLTEIFDHFGEGWIEVRPGTRGVTGFTLTGDYASSYLDGVSLLENPASALLFPEVQSNAESRTTLYLINDNPQTVPATLAWHGAAGSKAVTRMLPSRSLFKAVLSDLFPGKDGGYLRVETPVGQPVYGVELYGTSRALAALPGLAVHEASDDLFGAQLASVDGIDTVINLINAGAVADEVTLEAVSDAGRVVSRLSRTLGPGDQLRQSAGELFGWSSGGFVGWLRVQSGDAQLVGSLTFVDPRGEFAAALPLSAERAREFILSHVAQLPGLFTGVAILNPGARRALFSIEVFDSVGQRTGLTLREIEGQCKQSLLLKEWIPGFKDQSGGFIRVRSNRPIQGFELFGSSRIMATVPPQIILH